MHNVTLLPKTQDVDVADFLEREALVKIFNRAWTSEQGDPFKPLCLRRRVYITYCNHHNFGKSKQTFSCGYKGCSCPIYAIYF